MPTSKTEKPQASRVSADREAPVRSAPLDPKAERETRIAETVAALEAAGRELREQGLEKVIGKRIERPEPLIPTPLTRARGLCAKLQQPAAVAIPPRLAALGANTRPLPGPAYLRGFPLILRHPDTQDEVHRRIPGKRG